MKIFLLILIFSKISCQEDKFLKLVLASSASGVLAGGFYGSTVLLDESGNYSLSKIKSLSDSQKYYLKKTLVAAGSFGLSKALGFSNEGAMVIAGSGVFSDLIASKIKFWKNNDINISACASSLTAGLISTGALYKSLGADSLESVSK